MRYSDRNGGSDENREEEDKRLHDGCFFGDVEVVGVDFGGRIEE